MNVIKRFVRFERRAARKHVYKTIFVAAAGATGIGSILLYPYRSTSRKYTSYQDEAKLLGATTYISLDSSANEERYFVSSPWKSWFLYTLGLQSVLTWKDLSLWEMLAIARHGSPVLRDKIVQKIARKEIKDWEAVEFAQACDLDLSIRLAATGKCSPRLFLRMPKLTDESLEESCCTVLSNLPRSEEPCCADWFTGFALTSMQSHSEMHEDDNYDTVTGDILEEQSYKKTHVTGTPLVHRVLKALLAQSLVPERRRAIATVGGLTLLQRIISEYPEDVVLCSGVAEVLSNLAVDNSLRRTLWQGGWLGILSSWSQHASVKVLLPARKALLNLLRESKKLEHDVFQVHPTLLNDSNTKPPAFDVVFVHGLLGGVYITWRQCDSEKWVSLSQCQEKTPLKLSDLENAISLHQKWRSLLALSLSWLEDLTSRIFRNSKEERKEKEIPVDGECLQAVNGNNESEQTEIKSVPSREIPESTMQKIGSYVYGIGNYIGSFFSRSSEVSAEEKKVDDAGKVNEKEELVPNPRYSYCWPMDWLPKDYPFANIIALQYDTHLLDWKPKCPYEKGKRTLEKRSEGFLKSLTKMELGSRPIVWVAHSMGGLLIKQMLVQASQSDDPEEQRLFEQTRGMVFYSVPHGGSDIAAFIENIKTALGPSVEVQELKRSSPKLELLHEKFQELRKTREFLITSFAETKACKIGSLGISLMFVPLESANPGFGKFLEADFDHVNICKPTDRSSPLYQELLTMLQRIQDSL